MITEKYKIAGKVIEICSLHEQVHKYCAEYQTDEQPDFSITTSQSDINSERERNVRTAEAECRKTYDASDSYLEELSVYRKIAERMLDFDTFLFHGSCVSVDGEGYLFTAKSGTGKSTHTRLWREYLGERAVMVNDDKPLIRADGKGITVFGTPYNGKHRLGANISVPLKAVCILERSAENRIEQITRKQGYTMLIQQTYRPSDPLLMQKTLTLIDRLAEGVKLYRLGCNMDIEAAKVAYEGMK
ncbi:hypothetical protein SAMN02910317_02974 [Ruminococcaceae bacterium FB2012]|nr:hypothetical protein SAMN02910317_02974 [Ruminococcaceae bacterium FB2012]